MVIITAFNFKTLLRFSNMAALGALADGLVVHPVLDDRFELSTEIGAVEGIFTNDRGLRVRPGLAVPAQAICGQPWVHILQRLQENDVPIEPSGRTRSTTIPMVFANRTGLWGVFAALR